MLCTASFLYKTQKRVAARSGATLFWVFLFPYHNWLMLYLIADCDIKITLLPIEINPRSQA